jgi:hypothetical protein
MSFASRAEAQSAKCYDDAVLPAEQKSMRSSLA